MIGANQIFFLAERNSHNSLKKFNFSTYTQNCFLKYVCFSLSLFLIIQEESILLNFIFNSSLPNSRVKIDIGVKIPKKITPKTIGLTIVPRSKPIFIHKIFKGYNKLGLKNAVKEKQILIKINI